PISHTHALVGMKPRFLSANALHVRCNIVLFLLMRPRCEHTAPVATSPPQGGGMHGPHRLTYHAHAAVPRALCDRAERRREGVSGTLWKRPCIGCFAEGCLYVSLYILMKRTDISTFPLGSDTARSGQARVLSAPVSNRTCPFEGIRLNTFD